LPSASAPTGKPTTKRTRHAMTCVFSGKECGPDADCTAYGTDPVCECNMDGFLFNEPDKTCF
ncbi:unnamed protein product, partial [Closterium sp. Naga37s-1]